MTQIRDYCNCLLCEYLFLRRRLVQLASPLLFHLPRFTCPARVPPVPPRLHGGLPALGLRGEGRREARRWRPGRPGWVVHRCRGVAARPVASDEKEVTPAHYLSLAVEGSPTAQSGPLLGTVVSSGLTQLRFGKYFRRSELYRGRPTPGSQWHRHKRRRPHAVLRR